MKKGANIFIYLAPIRELYKKESKGLRKAFIKNEKELPRNIVIINAWLNLFFIK
jgi:hypothetical protein